MAGLIERWRNRRTARNTAAATARWVVVDCETSGLDVKRDRLLAIGAVAVTGARIVVEDSYVALLRQERPSAPANILVHGISATAQREGTEAEEAVRGFAAYSARDPMVAFHAPLDRAMLARAAREQGVALEVAGWLDLAELMPILFGIKGKSCRSLDDWLSEFAVRHSTRHDALGDAYATAQLFQVALAEAPRHGLRSVRDLLQAGRSGRWTGGAMP